MLDKGHFLQHLPSAVTHCTLKDLERWRQKRQLSVKDTRNNLRHIQACTKMSSVAGKGSVELPEAPLATWIPPCASHPPTPTPTVCPQAKTVPVAASCCPTPRTASSWQPNPRISLDAAGYFDLPSKCLVAAVYYLNATSGI